MKTSKKVLDRIGDTFDTIYKNLDLIVWIIGFYLLIYIISLSILQIIANFLVINNTFFLNINNYVMVILYGVYIIALILLNIGVTIGIIHHLSEIYKGFKPNIKDSFIYGLNNILKSFYTYYYVFMYTLMIPSIILIIELIILLVYIHDNNLNMWIIILIILINLPIGMLYFAYKGTRAIFGIYNASDKNEFSKENFIFSINITKNNVMRLIGNTMLIGLILGLAGGVFETSVAYLGLLSGEKPGMESLIENMTSSKNIDYTIIKKSIISLVSLDLTTAIQGLVGQFVNAVKHLTMVTFLFLSFKQLEKEYAENQNTIKNQIKPEHNLQDL